jgi:hypothetical protein
MAKLLFAGEYYYATGGFNDFKGTFSSLEQAMSVVNAEAHNVRYDSWEWWHIIDSDTLGVVARSDYQAHGCDEDCYTGEGENGDD